MIMSANGLRCKRYECERLRIGELNQANCGHGAEQESQEDCADDGNDSERNQLLCSPAEIGEENRGSRLRMRGHVSESLKLLS